MASGELGKYPLFKAPSYLLTPLLLPYMFVGFAYCIWTRGDYLIRITECLLILMKTGKCVGQRRYKKSCVKLAFTLCGYNKVFEIRF